MLYFKQILQYRLTPWSTNWLLTDVPGNSRLLPLFGSRDVYKKCNYGRSQYLFIYRLVLLKIIDVLDCILKNNQKEFIKPFKNIHFYYPVLLFIFNDIGLGRMKFLINQATSDITFDEFESLAGDEEFIIKKWLELRPRYLNYRGEIENLFLINGAKEYEIPVRLKVIIEQVDEILEFQRKQYSSCISPDVVWINKNTLRHNEKEILFLEKKDNRRKKIVKLFTKNISGLSSKTIKEKLSIKTETLKANITQINERLLSIDLAIKLDNFDKLYKLINLE